MLPLQPVLCLMEMGGMVRQSILQASHAVVSMDGIAIEAIGDITLDGVLYDTTLAEDTFSLVR
ncbi:hypothetical protein C805_02598 [Eubacterium sp. 14-2]|nr:hypothetical protein C805_02598 [Eubacterium sp. 14-2]